MAVTPSNRATIIAERTGLTLSLVREVLEADAELTAEVERRIVSGKR